MSPAAIGYEEAMMSRREEMDSLSILEQVAVEVSSELELPVVLRNIARLIKSVTGFSHMLIAVIDERDRFNWVYNEGYPKDVIKKLSLRTNQGVIGEAVSRREIITVGDVDKYPEYVPIPLTEGPPTRSEMAVPLVHKDRAIGVIGMESTEPEAFTDAHRKMMRSIATLLAAAVANARLHEQTLEQLKVMTLIQRIGSEISSVLDLEDLLREIAHYTKTVIDYQVFGIFLVDREKGEFVNKLSIGYDREALKARPVKLDEGLRGRALKHGRPLLVDDVQSDPQHVDLKLEIDDVVRSQMVIPLLTKNKIVGMLVLGNVKKRAYSSPHLLIASSLATQVAVALENARVFEEVASSEESLRSEMEFARKMQLSMLPDHCPMPPGFEICAESIPTARVGGDFYDFIELADGRLGVIIGDVSGYGMGGGLVANSAMEAIRVYSEFDPRPASVVNRTDKRLYQDLGPRTFVAMVYGVLDPKEKTFTFCNAGLIEPALIQGNQARFLHSPGNRLPLGVKPHGGYRPRTVRLRPGDTLVLATDGAIEVWNPDERQFGYRRFLRSLALLSGNKAKPTRGSDLISDFIGGLRRFAHSNQLPDDVTMLTIWVKA
jgi:sigma-B regulation protein RsbU (phosphoserine phosphatase)